MSYTSINQSNQFRGTPKSSVVVASDTNYPLTGFGGTIDGVALSVAQRVLLWQQSNPVENGLYVVASNGTDLALADDYISSDLVLSGMFCFVQLGNTYAGYNAQCMTPDPIVLGTDPTTWILTQAEDILFITETGTTNALSGQVWTLTHNPEVGSIVCSKNGLVQDLVDGTDATFTPPNVITFVDAVLPTDVFVVTYSYLG